MADIHLPVTLPPLFPGLSRRVQVEANSVGEALTALDARWPGLRDRVCDGARLRPHMRVFVDGERAELSTPLSPASRLDVIAAISGG